MLAASPGLVVAALCAWKLSRRADAQSVRLQPKGVRAG
jgi:hypothetical protein